MSTGVLSVSAGGVACVTPLDRFRRVAQTDAALLDEIAVAMLLSDVAGLQRFLQAREIDLNQRLRQLAAANPGIDPEAINARSMGRSAGNAGRSVRRADDAANALELKACMDEGRLSGEHLDAFTAALRSLDARLQPALRALEADLAARAVTQRATVEQFRTWLQREVRLIEADDGKQRLERQKRASRCRSWTDPRGRCQRSWLPAAGSTMARPLPPSAPMTRRSVGAAFAGDPDRSPKRAKRERFKQVSFMRDFWTGWARRAGPIRSGPSRADRRGSRRRSRGR